MSVAFVSYLRVSTERQGVSGLGLEAQRSSIARFVDACGGIVVEELVEIESGKRSDRPILEQAIALCRKRKATLLVAKLDRLARTVSFISRLIETGVDFVAVDNPHANKLMVHVISAFAEHERDLIAGRTRAALAAAKELGVVLGNPQIERARYAAITSIKNSAASYCVNIAPIIAQIRASGVSSFQGIADALTARGVPTRRGGQWHPATVRNIERRYFGFST